MDVNKLSDFYEEPLMISQGQVTCSGLSRMVEGIISHDKFTRLLSGGPMNETYLWNRARPLFHEIRGRDAVFIVDESIATMYQKRWKVEEYHK
jgi:hypothetical protein